MNTPTADRFTWQGTFDRHMAAAWERDGYLVLDDFVRPGDVARMRARADSLIEDFDIEAHKVVFSAKGQSHAASHYFMKSAANISFFLEEEAVDEDGRLLKDKDKAVNKIGHALHDLDPVFADVSHNADFETLSRGIGMADPLLLQSMVICKQPYIGGEVNTHQDSTFIYTEPESCTGFWLALEDATVENGCMWAAPGGHRSGLRQRFPIYEHDHPRRGRASRVHHAAAGEGRNAGAAAWPAAAPVGPEPVRQLALRLCGALCRRHGPLRRRELAATTG